MILRATCFLSCLLLGTFCVFLDYFPKRDLLVSSIISYLLYSKTFLEFSIERELVACALISGVCLYAAVWHIIPAITKPFYKEKRNIRLYLTLLFLSGGVYETCSVTRLPQYLIQSLQHTDIYRTHYTTFSTPPRLNKQPENIVFIIAESLENTYGNKTLFPTNLLRKTGKIPAVRADGQTEIAGLDSTLASAIGMFCGIPLFPVISTRGQVHSPLFSNMNCLPDILKKSGYHILFYTADPLHFASKDDFLKAHSFDEIKGSAELKSEKSTASNAFIGINDKELFRLSLERLKQLSRKDEPFAFFILTLNMHDPFGHLEKGCQTETKTFADVASCFDSILADFLRDLKKLPDYENTVVVVTGDHLARKNNLLPVLEKERNRTIFNMFLNIDDDFSKRHTAFTAMDIGATVLDAAGLSANGRLGLGRSLLRDEPTMLERYGKEKLESELMKKSDEYNSFLRE